jgi:hypothetical protein
MNQNWNIVSFWYTNFARRPWFSVAFWKKVQNGQKVIAFFIE